MNAPARALVLVATLVVAGCAQFTHLSSPEAVAFELEGRIAVRFRDEASSGGVAWRHRDSDDEVLLTSPLGQGVARIVRAENVVTLTTADSKEYRAADAESLTESVLGFRLPLVGLAAWVRGRAAAGPSQSRLDAEGRLERLEQAGWVIEYLDYAGPLPSRMKLSYPGLEIRLAISEWKQPAPNRLP
jgi:outer membrane lipoprotein LolB